MTSKSLVKFGVAVIVLVLGFVAKPDSSVEYRAFQSRFQKVLQQPPYQLMAESSCRAEQVTLPLAIQCHPRYWMPKLSRPDVAFSVGFPNSAEHYSVRCNDASLDCFVRYVEGRAT